MSYIVIGQENHPDKFLTQQAYGPFEDEDDAWEACDRLEAASENQIKNYGKKYYYHVRELMKV